MQGHICICVKRKHKTPVNNHELLEIINYVLDTTGPNIYLCAWPMVVVNNVCLTMCAERMEDCMND